MRSITAMKVIVQVAPEHHIALLEFLTDFPHDATVSSVGVKGPEKGLTLGPKPRMKRAVEIQVQATKDETKLLEHHPAVEEIVVPDAAPEEPPAKAVKTRPSPVKDAIRAAILAFLKSGRPKLQTDVVDKLAADNFALSNIYTQVRELITEGVIERIKVNGALRLRLIP